MKKSLRNVVSDQNYSQIHQDQQWQQIITQISSLTKLLFKGIFTEKRKKGGYQELACASKKR